MNGSVRSYQMQVTEERKMTVILVTFLLLIAPFSVCYAGVCWRQKHPDETCSGFHGTYKSKKDCCEQGGLAYSSDATKKTVFYYIFIHPPKCTLCNDPCSKITCESNWKCRVLSSGLPDCLCEPDCTGSNKGPVCGTDGRTYASECHLKKRACKNSRLRVEYNGQCRRNCENVQCSDQQVCIADKGGNSYCIFTHCPSVCPKSFSQVCGTDNKVYANKCALKKASCISGRKINFAYLGPCTAKTSCKDVRCPEKARCVVDVNNLPRCEYCGCKPSESGLPVCGSNGKKYKSWCHMRKHSCKTGRMIRVDPSLNC